MDDDDGGRPAREAAAGRGPGNVSARRYRPDMDDDDGGQAVRSTDIAVWRAALEHLDRAVDDAERIDQIRALEDLKAAICATQARITVDLEDSTRTARAAAGIPANERGKGIAAQVALARQESPARGGRLLGFAQALIREMPHTHAALRAGTINEWRATLLVRESACLTLADRATFDAQVATDHTRLTQLGDRALVAFAKQTAYRLDATSVVRRSAKAAGERRVTLRPAPDTMSHLSGLLPVAQGVSVYATLGRDADALRAQGDARSRGQLMADLLVQRVTGQTSPDDTPVEVQLVMTDRTLLAGDDEPATIPGYGTVPGTWARRLIAERTHPADDPEPDDSTPSQRRTDQRTRLFLRRLFTHPSTGQLVAMDSRQRTAPPGLARFINTRDQTCRTPRCDAPIRHHDHIIPVAQGGTTTAHHLQGTCEACNYTKEAHGWKARAGPPHAPHTVTLTTPTGHQYRSTAPPLPGHHDPPATPVHDPPAQPSPDQQPTSSRAEHQMQRFLDAA